MRTHSQLCVELLAILALGQFRPPSKKKRSEYTRPASDIKLHGYTPYPSLCLLRYVEGSVVLTALYLYIIGLLFATRLGDVHRTFVAFD